MNNIEMLEQQIEGCTVKLKELRADEAIFQTAKGLLEESEKMRVEASENEKKLEPIKEALIELKVKKTASLNKTVNGIINKMNEALPYGEPIFRIDNDVFIGWKVNDTIRPHSGLSGGEQVIFNGALEHALEANFLIYELAEADKGKTTELLGRLDESEHQIIASTCHDPESIPEDWNVIRLGG